MNLLRQAHLIASAAMAICLHTPPSVADRCTTEFRLPIVLRIASASAATIPIHAYLVGDITPGLRIIDSSNGRVLWTAGATGATTQRFAGMTAGFSSSLAALDTDGDGAHDRIYAGDLQGRLWRFDIEARGLPSTWITGGIFADLSAAPGRGFLAAPDLALIAPAGMKPWLSIALGTANTSLGQPLGSGAPGVFNRFYVLRDRAPLEHWTQMQYERWPPLVEADLRLAETTQANSSNDGVGYYINLGAQQVAASSVTLDGNTFFTAVSTTSSLLPTCAAPPTPTATTVSVTSISTDGALNATAVATSAIQSTAAGSAIKLVRDESSATETYVCEVAGQALPGCSFESVLKRSFWRREDAD